MIFPLAVSSLNNANQLIHYNNQLVVVEQYYTNIAAIQNMGVLWQIWTYKIYWGILLICQNTTMEHGLKDIALYVKKHTTPRVVLS